MATIVPDKLHKKESKQHHVPDHDYARTIACNKIDASAPFRWVRLGIKDFFLLPTISFFYGLCFMAAAIAVVQLTQWQGSHLIVLPSLIVFMLIGPFLALGLYDASWQREKGHQANLLKSIKAINRNSTSQWAFAVLLTVTLIFWMRIAALVHVFYPQVESAPLADFIPFLLTNAVIGLVVAGLIFSISAFSIPLMMERRVDMMTAVFTSFNAVKENLSAMIVWAIMICIGTLIGFATYGVGMLAVIPILGYGTWHAYRETIVRK
ncbi:DUF2189 domain-containing protein [Vibrio sp. DW001]|uniref:DUF2189 domain-containing protein n=1 Tax=unclassified Vibrio TaxID=2614977 RepID=UPI0018A07ED6|nr:MULTISPECIES: DUF2189 domain-containing protein [unclassified Vibrio]UGA55165.1 DUF2189 domain-containing protein [Vibrio sp. VB16]WED27055.1 DUF2189 domain-containing protein [Vibrio sp. DW001]